MAPPREPRPAEFRDAFIGAVLMLLGAYIGGGAIWSWLFGTDQDLDPSRIYALIFSGLMIFFGYLSFQAWLKGEWFYETKWARPSNLSNSSDNSSSSGSASGSNEGMTR